MESISCSMCNIGKHIKIFYKKNPENKDCNSRSGLKRYFGNKDKKANQRKIGYEKKDKVLNEIYYKQPKRNHATNKTIILMTFGFFDILKLKDYSSKNNGGLDFFQLSLIFFTNLDGRFL